MKILDKIESYLFGKNLRKYHSALNGELEVCIVNGVKMLHSATANYSYGGLHKVFRKALATARIAAKKPETVLVLGFGAGSIATILQEELRIECSITGVEHDPVILEIFSEHFQPERFEKLELLNMDAASFIAGNLDSYELVCIDVFDDKEVPDACLEPTFLQKLSQAVSTKGVLIFNIIVENEAQRLKHKLLKQYFNSLKGNLKEKFVAPSNSLLIWEKA